MDFIHFCVCGRPVDDSFVYCPWCGRRRKDDNDSDVLENVFSQLETKQTENRASRVRKIQRQIEELEKELDKLSEKSDEKAENADGKSESAGRKSAGNFRKQKESKNGS